MRSTSRTAAVAACTLTGLTAAPSIARAQAITAPELFANGFFPNGPALGMNPRVLEPFDEKEWSKRDVLEVGLSRDQTVRTTQQGRHVGDLYGPGWNVAASLGTGKRISGQVFFAHSNQDALFVDTDGTRTAGGYRSDMAGARMNLRVGRGQVYLDYCGANTHADVQSDVFRQALPVFPGTPGGSVVWSSRQATVGAVWPVSSRVRLEGSLGRPDNTRSFALDDGASRVEIPVGTAGFAWSLASAFDEGRKTSYYAYWQRSDASGHGHVMRDRTADAGENTSSDNQTRWGIAARRQCGATGTLALSISHSMFSVQSHGQPLNSFDLGYNPFVVSSVGYYLNGQMTQRQYGASWEQRFRRGNRLVFDYRWIETPVHIDYGYTAAWMFIGIQNGQTHDIPDARGHLLALHYTMPARRDKVRLDLSQVVPLPIGHTSGPATTPPSPARSAYGGWDIAVSYIHPL